MHYKKLKQAWQNQAGIKGTQQLGNSDTSKQRETSTVRLRLLQTGSDLQKSTGTYYKVEQIDVKIAIFTDKHNQDHILEGLGRIFHGTLKGEILHLRL
jgi:hypothetical protein